MTCLCGMAQTARVYTESLIITINDEQSEPQVATLMVADNGDATINFTLKNFMLVSGVDMIPVGNVNVVNIPVEKGEDGLLHFECERDIIIEEGDLSGIPMWIGPSIGEIPLKLKGKLNDEKLFVTIDIDMQLILGQVVFVQLGTDDFPRADMLGDLNGDADVNIADAVIVLNLMAEDGYDKAADINGDADVNIADFVSILNIMAEQ